MVKHASKKIKKPYQRQERKLVLIAAEGINKTEKTYFNEFNRKQREYTIQFCKGDDTDPVHIVDEAIRSMNNSDFESDFGDIAFAVMDTDFGKEIQISEARKTAENNGVNLILSNPCFEIWLLLHFRYSTRSYYNNNEVIDTLKTEWPEYRKNIASYDTIADRLGNAMVNAERLKRYHENVNSNESIEFCNPSTDVYRVVKVITGK